MAKEKQNDQFWTSYSDLMTSLFFVMLVLLIICIAKVGKMNGDLADKVKELDSLNHVLNAENHVLDADNEDLQNILRLEEQFRVLSQSSSLEYDSYQLFSLASETYCSLV